MAKRAKTADRKKNTPKLVKGAQGVTPTAMRQAAQGTTLPARAKAAKAVPVPAIVLAVGACAIGALALFLFDATEGQRRRQLIRDKALQAGETITKSGREVRQRLESVATQATQR